MNENPDKNYRMSELEVQRLARQGAANESKPGIHDTQLEQESEPEVQDTELEKESAPVRVDDLLSNNEYGSFSLKPVECLKKIRQEHPTVTAKAVIGFMHFSPQTASMFHGIPRSSMDERTRDIVDDPALTLDTYEVIFELLKEAGFARKWIDQYIADEIADAETSQQEFNQKQLRVVLNTVFSR